MRVFQLLTWARLKPATFCTAVKCYNHLLMLPLHSCKIHVSRLMTKPTKWHVRPAKTQVSLDIRPVWSESSLCTQCVAKGPSFLHADSEDSDQTGRMPRLIWVFAGRRCHFVGFVVMWLIYYHCNAILVATIKWDISCYLSGKFSY